jgi:hypothetical protein
VGHFGLPKSGSVFPMAQGPRDENNAQRLRGSGSERPQYAVLRIRIRIHRIHMFWASWIRIH